MGTYSRPGLTQGESALIDKSGSKINTELLDFGVNFETAKANIRLNEEAALTQQMQIYRQAEEIDDPNAAENSVARGFANQLRAQADDLYYTTINSMGEDQTDTIKKEENIINAVQDLGGNLGVIQLESENYVNAIRDGEADLVGFDSDPGARALYSNMGLYGGAGSSVNGVNPVQIEIINGNSILSQEYIDTDGKKQVYKYSLNNQALSRANGAQAPVTMVDKKAVLGGYEGEWKTQVKKYPALKMSLTDNRGNKKTVQETMLYDQQAKEAYNGIVNDEQAIALIDSDDYQMLVFNGFYEPGKDETWNGSEDQKRNLQKAKADYLVDAYSQSDRTTQKGDNNVAGSTILNDPKSGKGEKKVPNLNHTDFIENTFNEIEVDEVDVEGPLVKIKDAKPGKLYRNETEFYPNGNRNPDYKKTYRFDGKKYVYLDPEKDDFPDPEKLKVQRLDEIKEYLENHPSSKVFRGNNAEVKESNSVDNPDPNKLYRKGGTIAKPTFKEIDFDDLFREDVLGDLNKMEVALNKALGITPI